MQDVTFSTNDAYVSPIHKIQSFLKLQDSSDMENSSEIQTYTFLLLCKSYV